MTISAGGYLYTQDKNLYFIIPYNNRYYFYAVRNNYQSSLNVTNNFQTRIGYVTNNYTYQDSIPYLALRENGVNIMTVNLKYAETVTTSTLTLDENDIGTGGIYLDSSKFSFSLSN